MRGFVECVPHSEKNSPYVINLDPAVHELPYPCNVDIRDTVNYKQDSKSEPAPRHSSLAKKHDRVET